MSHYRIAPPLQILQDACEKADFSIEFIGEESGHLAKVSNGRDFFYAGGAGTPTYPLNNAVSHDLCADKAYSYELLKKAGVGVPEGRLFFPGFDQRNQYDIVGRGAADALSYVQEIGGYPVIVKPNRGSMGRGVCLVDNDTDLILAMQKTLEFGHACLVQEVVKGDEWRLFCLDGEPRFMYRKVKPFVKGDGELSFGALISHLKGVDLSKLDRGFIESELGRQRNKFLVNGNEKMLWDAVLKKDYIVDIAITGNLALGACISDFTTEISNNFHQLSSLAYKALKARVVGIDFFLQKDRGAVSAPVVIEVNGNPSLRGAFQAGYEDLCLDIWLDIMKRYFAETQ